MNSVFFSFTLQKQFFDFIAEGRKSVEGRVFRPKYQELKAGDKIIFKYNDNPSHYIEAELLYLNKYQSFESMLQNEGVEKCLPDINSINEAVKVYHQFPQYKELEESHGVLAIGFKVIKVVSLK